MVASEFAWKLHIARRTPQNAVTPRISSWGSSGGMNLTMEGHLNEGHSRIWKKKKPPLLVDFV